MSGSDQTMASCDQYMIEIKSRSLWNVEKVLIKMVLEQTGWNLNRSAKLLHISRGSLYSKMKKHDIKRLTKDV